MYCGAAGNILSDTRLGEPPGSGGSLSQGWHPEAKVGFAGKQPLAPSLASIAPDIHDVGPDLRGRLSGAVSDGRPSHNHKDHELAPKEQLKQRASRLAKGGSIVECRLQRHIIVECRLCYL